MNYVYLGVSQAKEKNQKAQRYHSLPCWRNSKEAPVIRTEKTRRVRDKVRECGNVATILAWAPWRIFGTETVSCDVVQQNQGRTWSIFPFQVTEDTVQHIKTKGRTLAHVNEISTEKAGFNYG